MRRAEPLAGTYALPRWRPTAFQASLAAAVLLGATSWGFIFSEDRHLGAPFFSKATLNSLAEFARALMGIGSANRPAFLSANEWLAAASLASQTLAMSVLAAGIAALIALATFMFGARNVMLGGGLAPYSSLLAKGGFWLTRGFFILTRGTPELVWALVLVFVLSPGILPSALALGIHNGGILGKLGSEVVENMDTRPVRALRSTGASQLHVLLYGALPQALPRFITYLLYRWEVIIRTTIVVGFVAAGGLGMEFRLNMSHFHYTSVTLLLLCYLLLVLAVDLAAAGLRKLAR